MELTTYSTNEKPDQARSVLGIDLNEIPSPSSSEALSLDAFAVVRTFHANLSPPAGSPAVFPGDTYCSVCTACGRSEVRGHLVVCDGCERGFHVGCAGIRGRQVEMLDIWMCGECVSNGVPSNRWTLGSTSKASGQKRGKVRFLDINASPHSDGEGEGSEDFPDLRKHTPGDNSFGGNPVGTAVTYSKSLYVRNGFGFLKASGILRHPFKLSFEDILHHSHSVSRSFEEVDMHSILGRLRSSNQTATSQGPPNPSEMCLQALREFISERNGVLEEGWCVEFKTSIGSGELHAIYCAPDGKTFDSPNEVACHLGLMSDCNSVEPKVRSYGSDCLAKRRKSARLSMANVSGLCEDLSSEFHTTGCASKLENNVEVVGARPEENNGTGPQKFNDGLPVQYEDFFVLSLGKVDDRPSYHNVKQIWPVGYRSCWHDKITGSLFICDVLDGGDSGPVFKVSRCSCSTLPIPNGSTVLFTQNLRQAVCENKEKNGVPCASTDYEEYCSVQMLLSDASPSIENDILSCLGSFPRESFNVQTSNCLQPEASPLGEAFGNVLSDTLVLRDEIGEFSVEESLSSSAWRMLSKKFIDTCRRISTQRGALKLFCEHVENGTSSTSFNCTDEKEEGRCISLARFFGSSPSIKIPSVILGGVELETGFEVLAEWLDQDRFGLDVDFVQEIIEQLPGVHACSQYVSLKERSYYSSSVTVGNGLLLVESKDGVQAKDKEALDGIFSGCKRSRTEMVEDPMMESPRSPLGNPISSKLPLEIVGDVLQIWEFLWRFYEVLGLEDPLPIEELEEELICPWLDGLNHLEQFGGKVQENHDIASPRTDGSSQHILSSSTESGPAVTMENPLVFIEMQTEAMKEAAQARVESVTSSSCTGIALTKVHCSMLKVLIGELQSRVAAIRDPNFDIRESKPKHGKKKDVDFSVATKGTKVNMLPINELTWPELARRYILAVLSMDGNIHSPEIADRESGKVFRCLQGDGGVLCGSLTGVLGMEADALLLAQAMKKIFGSLNRENDMLCMDDGESDATEGNIPEWAELLEPVRKLPTNVGARIRKCVYNALEKGPPEWAKKILEHSISKEVYKGNACGPTKKAVLSVLADAYSEGIQQKTDRERKKKNFISVCDVTLKKCRIVLRRAAGADNAKVFCKLLGRKLISFSGNYNEGILGSSAMVSRPLDFRTIDLRLAVGAYDGSHEAFLEDVQELWTHMRIACAGQPDLVQLVETLSSNFKALYEKEVVSLFQKFVGYAKLGCLPAESKKEIDDFLLSSSELPKAPWEEGVCKVCGIDKDDDSVLLCDTCDAEYHTYCLNPPLARIPHGNWYCPSCVANKDNVQDASECISNVFRNRRKYHGEVTHVYLDALTSLASVLGEKEYWEFSLDERTVLLKFLCDELLNSALIHQHLEQSAEVSADLQQKLRSLSIEWRNLKYKEELLVANVAKTCKYPSFSNLEEKSAGNGLITHPLDAEDQCKNDVVVVEGSQLYGNFFSHTTHLEKDKSFGQKELLPSNILQQEINDLHRESSFKGGMKTIVGRDVSTLPFPEDLQGSCPSLDSRNSQIGEHVPAIALNETQDNSLELNLVRKDISLLQDSISRMEMQLLKLSVRREFLGSDSAGRLYWVLAKRGRHPWVIVNSKEMPLQQGEKITSSSGASCSYVHELNDANNLKSPWVYYQSDTEIKELVECLRDDHPKERELKESILHWLKQRFQDPKQTEKQGQGEPHMASSGSMDRRNSLYLETLSTKAASLLEKKYGPWSELENIDFLKKRGRKAKVSTEDKIFRCHCLELVWPFRHHCLSCHRTFFTEVELEGHDDCTWKLGLAVSKKSKAHSALKGKGIMKSETLREECTNEVDIVRASKSGYYEPNSKLIKYQNDGLACPYDFKEICSKFVMKNSNKELVQEIGLLSSNGIPMFIPSVSPYLSDPALMLVPLKREVFVSCDELKTDEQLVFAQGIRVTTNKGHDGISSNPPKICAANELVGEFESDKPVFGCSEQKDEKSSFRSRTPALELGNCCVISESALRPLVGNASQIIRRLKINLLDMDAALPEAALRRSKAHLERRWAWRAFVKSAESIYEMVQAVIVFEDMIKTEYLRNMWWNWSSLSAAAKISTLSSLALRIYSLDASIDYEKNSSNLDQFKLSSKPDQKPVSLSDATEKFKLGRKLKRKRGD